MAKTILYISLTVLIFITLISSPVKARKRLRLEELKTCAQESVELPSLQEKFKKAQNYTQLLRQKASQLYDKTLAKKNSLDKMPREINEEIDIYNQLVVKYNQQADQQRKAVEIFNSAVRKLNLLRTKIQQKQRAYISNCTKIFYRRKHIWIVCGKEEYKNTTFCKQR